jgi:hypothetical protein
MPRIVQLAAVTIYIYGDDHAPPHFHVIGRHQHPGGNRNVASDAWSLPTDTPCPSHQLGGREPCVTPREME